MARCGSLASSARDHHRPRAPAPAPPALRPAALHASAASSRAPGDGSHLSIARAPRVSAALAQTWLMPSGRARAPRLVLRPHALRDRVVLAAALHFVDGSRQLRSRLAIDPLCRKRAVIDSRRPAARRGAPRWSSLPSARASQMSSWTNGCKPRFMRAVSLSSSVVFAPKPSVWISRVLASRCA
jgi:hypothetical protein